MLKNQSVATIAAPEFINIEPYNPLISQCEIKVLYVGENRNGSYITKEVAKNMANALPGTPIVAAFLKEKGDFGDHGEVITIEDQDFPTFYIDTFDHKDRYNEKIVEYDGQVFFSKKLPKNTFILGRKIMNCCAQDIQLCGFLVKSCLDKKLKDRSYIHIKAKLVYEFSSDYNEEEVMLEPIKIKEIEPLKEEVLNLVG